MDPFDAESFVRNLAQGDLERDAINAEIRKLSHDELEQVELLMMKRVSLALSPGGRIRK
jgi:hypothetical protein